MDLAQRVKEIKPSPTLAVDAKAKALLAQGVDVIGFGAGEPDFDTPENIKDAAIKALKAGFTKYTPSSGIPVLRQAIADKFKRENGLAYKPSQVIVNCGGKHSCFNVVMATCEEGDEVLIPAPYWVSYPDMVLLAGATPVIIKTAEKTGFRMTAADLEKAITKKTKALILNSPSNPTGASYTKEDLTAIAQVLLKTGITVISDEIYEKLVYDGFSFSSIASVDPKLKNQAIVVNGVSKSYSMTGWRIGYAAGPKPLITAMTNIQSQSTSNPTSISQKASLEALNGPQDFIQTMLKEFDRRRTYMVDRLNAMSGVSCFKPSGAFYAFPNFSGVFGRTVGSTTITDSTTLSQYLLESVNVAVVPGVAFGADENIRLSYATSFENIQNGLDRIQKAIEALT